MLRTRFLTALILLPLVLLAIIYLPTLYFAVLFAALLAMGAWEWSGLVGLSILSLRVGYVILVMLGVVLVDFSPFEVVMLAGIVVWIWLFLAILTYQNSNKTFGFSCPVVRSIVGFIVLIACMMAVMTLKAHQSFGAGWLIFVLCLIWSVDIGAYFSGRHFGRRALVSRVSPNKTWAGFVGGMSASFVVACVGGLFFNFTWASYLIFLIVAIITAFASVIGDLGVSLLKRISGVKDTGNIIPGHGGVLDRLDSVVAATVVFVSLAYWLGW